MNQNKPETFGEQHARAIKDIRKKSLETFIPDFFSMGELERIEHISFQESADYLIKLREELIKQIPNGSRRAYYENQIYQRIYKLVTR